MKNFLKIIQNVRVNKKMGNFFFERLYMPQQIVNKSFLLLKNVSTFSETFKKCNKQKNQFCSEKSLELIKAIIDEIDDRLEDITEYLKTSKVLFKEAVRAWNYTPFFNCKSKQINKAFDRYIFYADCHLKYAKVLQNNDLILSHNFECINWIIKLFFTSYFNPKHSNTEFLDISTFLVNNVIEDCMKILKEFDVKYMDQIIEIVCTDLPNVVMNLCATLGETYIFNKQLLYKRRIIQKTEFKQYVLNNINDLLFRQFATVEEKYSVINAPTNLKNVYRAIILDRILAQHKDSIENEIV